MQTNFEIISAKFLLVFGILLIALFIPYSALFAESVKGKKRKPLAPPPQKRQAEKTRLSEKPFHHEPEKPPTQPSQQTRQEQPRQEQPKQAQPGQDQPRPTELPTPEELQKMFES